MTTTRNALELDKANRARWAVIKLADRCQHYIRLGDMVRADRYLRAARRCTARFYRSLGLAATI